MFFPFNIPEISERLAKRLNTSQALLGVGVVDRYPIRGIFVGCCASAKEAVDKAKTRQHRDQT